MYPYSFYDKMTIQNIGSKSGRPFVVKNKKNQGG